jgi:hypothetical protein
MNVTNNDKTVRQMQGRGTLHADYYYPLQTLNSILSLFTPGVLARIHRIVLKIENSTAFKDARRKHSDTESLINVLANHGLIGVLIMEPVFSNATFAHRWWPETFRFPVTSFNSSG